MKLIFFIVLFRCVLFAPQNFLGIDVDLINYGLAEAIEKSKENNKLTNCNCESSVIICTCDETFTNIDISEDNPILMPPM
jgi:hypothetical protein